MYDIKEFVDLWHNNGDAVALATVVETWGSSPRRVGAKMAVNDDGRIIGSVSGGCVEAVVIQEATRVLRDGAPALLDFGVEDDRAWSVGLSCGGRLTVFVERLSAPWWRSLWRTDRGGGASCTATVLKGSHAGAKLSLDDEGPLWKTPGMESSLDFDLTEAARQGIRQRRSERRTVSELDILVDCHLPKPRLILIGGAHVAMALSSFADTLGFSVVLIDPRKVFASRTRFPGVAGILHDYPQEVLPGLQLDSDTYVAVLTHDPKIDDPAMLCALPSPAPYVGVLSSRKTHVKRRERLVQSGLDPSLLERIQVPIGLDIGAKTPEEIALAIMAQIVAIRNQGNQP